MIRELREENEKLQKKLKDQGSLGFAPDSVASVELRNQIKEQERALAELNRSWAMKLEETILHQQVLEKELQAEHELEEKKKQNPCLVNINEDPFLTGLITASHPHVIKLKNYPLCTNVAILFIALH